MRSHFNNEHIQLLINAFQNDPMFVELFKGPKRHLQMEAFFRFIYKRNQVMDGIYLTDSSNNPSYVAFIETPKHRHRYNLKSKIQLYFEMLKLILFIPLKSLNFLSRYDVATMKHRPREKHLYLTMIGVSPEKQGQGIGKMVINTLHKMVIDDPDVSGICLDTENLSNVLYYERLGFSLIQEVKVSSISVYCMKKFDF